MTYEHQAECAKFGGGGCVRRAFVTLIDEGKAPEGKGPFLTSDHLDKFIREAIACRPAATKIIVHELTWNDKLWTEDGRERVEIDKDMEGVDLSEIFEET